LKSIIYICHIYENQDKQQEDYISNLEISCEILKGYFCKAEFGAPKNGELVKTLDFLDLRFQSYKDFAEYFLTHSKINEENGQTNRRTINMPFFKRFQNSANICSIGIH
jgi:hypothetical protein